MKKQTKEGTLAIVGTSVFEQLQAVNHKLATVKAITDTPYKTSGLVTTANGQLNIKTATDQKVLVLAFSSVLARLEALDKAYEELGATGTRPVSQIDGASLEEWKADFKLRLNIIQNQEKLDKLNKIKEGLTDLMGRDEKAALLMQQLENI